MRRHLTAGLLAGLSMTGFALAQDAAGGAAAAAGDAAPAAAENAAPASAETVLATVDGVDITLGHAIVMRDRLPEQYQSLPDDILLNGIVDQLIDQTLLAAEESGGPDSDPLEVRLHLENERRGALAARVVAERVAAPVDAAAVDAAYAAQVKAFTPATEYNASHILVASEEEAAAVIAELEGGADFAELAKTRSTDPGSGPQGGSLGWFGAGQMVPAFEAAAGSLEPGTVSAPVQTDFGWHVIRLEETRQTAAPTIEELRPEIEAQLRQEKLASELKALRAAASIERPEATVAPAAIRQNELVQN